MSDLTLFADGSVDPGSGRGYGACLAFGDTGQSVEALEPLVRVAAFDSTSSTALELQVVLHALGELEGFGGRVTVYTDSQNVVGLRARRARLEDAGYRNGRGHLLKHHELYRQFYRRIENLDCEFIKVQGHRAKGQSDRIERIFALVDRASRRALRESVAD